ncbi:PorH family porin [Corynebacterium sp. CCM 9185]|uniref:PorH family porin n=1 Tax=Corynebacterium marambiense TaxID=2765364 RepID=A0ABS0VWA6_9CORY|nr:PorH family porin [Corynebacterium marambiense]MBI9001035.1 PorH family porin [Corynebacterium marambiense]MCK7664276.1 PorH family porin [Corynebacterium marambiense]MCX7543088.1 PorH family porin [Corynebacterium marambiense]
MDFTVIKEQLGDFNTFVDAMGKLVENFPKVVEHIDLLFKGDVTTALSSGFDGISSK